MFAQIDLIVFIRTFKLGHPRRLRRKYPRGAIGLHGQIALSYVAEESRIEVENVEGKCAKGNQARVALATHSLVVSR